MEKLLVQIVHEECAEPLRDLKHVPDLLERIFRRVGQFLEENQPFVGDSEPIEQHDESEAE